MSIKKEDVRMENITDLCLAAGVIIAFILLRGGVKRIAAHLLGREKRKD